MTKISILFSASITLIILHSYTAYISAVLVLPVVFCVYHVYRFCEHCYAKRLRGRFLLGFLLVSALMIMLISISNYDIAFNEWLYVDISYLDYFLYFLTLFIGCCFIATTIVFYFTVIVYRSLFLFVFLLIPFGLSFTRLSGVPFFYTLPAIGLYFALMIVLGKKELAGYATQVDYRYVYAFTAAVCIVTSFSFLVDLPENARRLGRDGRSGLPVLTGLLEYSLSSGVADASQDNEEILFLAQAEEQIYFIRQIFVEFNGDMWMIDFDSELIYGAFAWEAPAEALNLDKLFAFALEAYDSGMLSGEIMQRVGFERLMNSEQVKTTTVFPQPGYAATFILAPPRTFGLSGLPSGLPHARNRLGEIFITLRGGVGTPYTMTYYSDFFRRNQDFQSIVQLSTDDFDDLLTELTSYFLLNYDDGDDYYFEYSTLLTSFRDDFSDAMICAEYLDGFQSARISALAAEITDGLVNDYEKAVEIERFFRESGYKYDAAGDYIEVNMDIEHFIFESQSGTCGHFATAMALMARSIGLNARYVEGFTSTEINDDGLYVIRAGNSHAFVQVYIPFYGWVIFDPTVPRDEFSGGTFRMFTEITFTIFVYFSILILIGLAGYLVYTRFIMEKLFIRKAEKSSGPRGIILIYGKVLKLARQKLGMDNMSSAELLYAVHGKYGLDISIITTCFERAFFGDESVSSEEKNEALEVYKQLYSRL